MRTYIHAHHPRYIPSIRPSVYSPTYPISPCKTIYIHANISTINSPKYTKTLS